MDLEYGKSRTRELIRQTSLQLREVSFQIAEANIDDALAYFERRSDFSEILEKYKERYARGIRKKDGKGGFEMYAKTNVQEALDEGVYEIMSICTGPRISKARATLFTNKTQSWDYVTGEGQESESDEETAKIITEQRLLGGFKTQLPNADNVACSIESGPLSVGWFGGHLNYKAFSPSCLYAKYGERVMDDGVERATNPNMIEDASCIVILLSGRHHVQDGNPQLNQYIAYFGRSEDLPYGRMVSYTSNTWKNIPSVDQDDSAIEYRLKSGEVANPLSYMAAKKAKYGVKVPEYPVCIFKGGLSMTDDSLMPISTSLFEACLEIDLAISRILKAGLMSAIGKDVLTNELGHDLPRCLEGAVLLHKGQTLQIMGQPVSNAQGAMEITKDMIRALAEGYSVPGYRVMETPGGNPESGVALVVRTQPLIEERENRINGNALEVDRLWNIERNMYEFVTGKPLGNADTRQVWDAGRYVVPESEMDKVNRLKIALDNGGIDYVRYIRDLHMFPTDKDAMDFIDKMNDPERMKYKAPTKTGAQRTGLPLSLGAKLQEPPKLNEKNEGNEEEVAPPNGPKKPPG